MTLYVRYVLVFLFAVAPVLAHDDYEITVTIQQQVTIEQKNELNPLKEFLNRCYKYRYEIAMGALAITVAAVGICHACSSTQQPIKSLVAPEGNSPVGLEANFQTTLPEIDSNFTYPEGYSDLSKQRIEQLRKIHPLFGKLCSGICSGDAYADKRRINECGQVVEELEEIYRNPHRSAFMIKIRGDNAIDATVAEPIERLNAKELLDQAINKVRASLK